MTCEHNCYHYTEEGRVCLLCGEKLPPIQEDFQ